MTKNAIIREAKKEDVAQIYQLIKELAEFEKCPNSVKITEKQLEEDGFGSNPPAYECFVAENSPGEIIGFALIFHKYSTWFGKTLFLEDFYIKPEFRKCGIGKKFIKMLAKYAHEREYMRIDFNVLKWNPAKEFYKKLGAINATENEQFELYRFYEDSIQKLAQDQ